MTRTHARTHTQTRILLVYVTNQCNVNEYSPKWLKKPSERATARLPEKSRMLNPHNKYKEGQQLKTTSVSGTHIHTLGPIRVGS